MEYLFQNWWYLLLIGCFAFMMFRRGGCCSGHTHDEHNCGENNHSGHFRGSDQHSSHLTGNRIETVRDPECGMLIDTFNSVKQKIDGKTYYFCSETCRANFAGRKTDDKSA